MIPAEIYEVTRGAQWDGVLLQCFDENGVAVDLTGCTVTCVVKNHLGDSITLLATVSTNQIQIIPVIASETVNWVPSEYYGDLFITWPGGILRGPWFIIKLAVSNAVSIP